jgi:hypothetical protein
MVVEDCSIEKKLIVGGDGETVGIGRQILR